MAFRKVGSLPFACLMERLQELASGERRESLSRPGIC